MNKYKVTVGAWHTVDVHAMNNAGAEKAALASMEAMGLCPKLWHEVEVTDVLLKEENIKPQEITTTNVALAANALSTGDFQIFMLDSEGLEIEMETNGCIMDFRMKDVWREHTFIIRQKLS